MKILVTGGAGFIGSHVVDRLIAKRHAVTVVDNFATGYRENINAQARVVRLDIASKKIDEVFARFAPKAVIHCAAQISVRKSVEDPLADASINILGSLRLWSAAQRSGVKHVVFASSGGAMYGDECPRPTSELEPANPCSPYGIAKLAAEQYLRYTQRQSSMVCTSLRFSNVYGPRQRGDGEAGVVSIFIQKLLHHTIPSINGNGRQTRDFVYVDDVVSAIEAALAAKNSGTMNIGTGIETSINTIYQLVIDSLNVEVKAKHKPAKSGEQQRSSLDAHRALKELGWKSTVPVREGIRRTVEWFAKYPAMS